MQNTSSSNKYVQNANKKEVNLLKLELNLTHLGEKQQIQIMRVQLCNE